MSTNIGLNLDNAQQSLYRYDMRKNTIEDGMVIGCMAPKTLVKKLDKEADREGIPRSVVMRRILLRHFQSKRKRGGIRQ